MVDFNPLTGEVQQKKTHQGLHDLSAWARGQAWGLYGFICLYKYSKDLSYLVTAEKIANFIMNHPNLPADKIPYWDFEAYNDTSKRDIDGYSAIDDNHNQRYLKGHHHSSSTTKNYDKHANLEKPSTSTHQLKKDKSMKTNDHSSIGDILPHFVPRDTSAAAIIASAMLELSAIVAEKYGNSDDIRIKTILETKQILTGNSASDNALAIPMKNDTSTRSLNYLNFAITQLTSLMSDNYRTSSSDENLLLLKHATGQFPKKQEVDCGLVYADYYYLEAIRKCLAMEYCRLHEH